MRKLTEFSVNHPIAILMLVFVVLLLGYISFTRLGIDLFPDLNTPRIFVELQAGERPPEEIEQRFVDRIEMMAMQQRGAVQVSSISSDGSAQITVEYSWDTDMDAAFLDLQKALTDFSQYEDIEELNLTQHDPNAAPTMLLGLSHPQIEDLDELRRIAENYIRNELVRLEGIAAVDISGQEEKEVVVETNHYLLEAHNLTLDDISRRIQSLNRNVSGGHIVEMGLRYIIKGIGVFQSLDDIGNIILAYREPEELPAQLQESPGSERIPVFLKDVATIAYRNKEPENIVRINRQRCLGLSVYKEMKSNTVEAAQDLLKALQAIRKALPGYELTIIQNQGEFITRAVNEVKQTALIGIILAILVLYVFLRRIGTTAIISVAIPISIVATFNLMYFKGLSLNIMTLGGLALGAGMLVDNAIVVMENIHRNLESGLTIKEAAIVGTTQVGSAITASTITTIVVFLPIVYLHGAAGELFKDQAWTVAFSLVSSLVVAILFIPMLSIRFLKEAPTITHPRSIQFRWYAGVLDQVLNRRWLTIGLAAALVGIAVLLIPIVGSEFVPKTDLGEFSIELRLPEGTELHRTEHTVDNVEHMVRTILGDDVETIFSRIGPVTEISSDKRAIFEGENTATMKIVLREDHRIPSDKVIPWISSVLTEIPDLEATFIQEQTALQATLGTESAPVIVEIKGEDLNQLEALTDQVKQQLVAMNELFNVETSFEEGRPAVEVIIDRLRAGLSEMDVNDISSQLKDQLIGKDAGQWESEGERRDITLRLPRLSVSQLENLFLTKGNQKIRLGDITYIRMGRAPREIHRRNQARIGRVTAHQRGDEPFDRVIRRIEEKLGAISFPPGYRMEITGEEQKREREFRSLKFALILSVILVYMVLASQFESLIHPFTILLTIPLAGVGAILIFFVLGRSLNIMAYIGIIMLAGIAVNDSIILVDAINRLKREGLPRRNAIIEAGQRRIRPIIMTSITTILALLPLTFGFGEGASLRSPMALAVIGGLITSTILTLFVIPCVYLVLDQMIGEMKSK